MQLMQRYRHRNGPRRYYPPAPTHCIAFAFGSNGSGQLGLPHEDDTPIPEQVRRGLLGGLHKVKQIIGSGNHTLLVQAADGPAMCTTIGASHIFEDPGVTINMGGQLLTEIMACAATWDAFAVIRPAASLGLTDGSYVIQTFGSPEKGQLGRPRKTDPVPHMDNEGTICLVPEIECLAGGVQHFVAVLKTGEVIGWGNGRKGQLGDPCEATIDRPRMIEGIEFKVAHVVCGREFTLLLGDPAEGRLLVLGSDKFGVKSEAPKEVKNWKQAGAGWGTISVLLDNGEIKSWGRNDHGQQAPKGLPPIEQLAVGSEHSVALSRTGQVLVWGWGEHGNCGKDTDENGDVKGRWNEIALPELDPQPENWRYAIGGVGAGCATSWFWYCKP